MKQYKVIIVMTQVNSSSVRVGTNYFRARAVTSGCRYISTSIDDLVLEVEQIVSGGHYVPLIERLGGILSRHLMSGD